MTFKKGQKAHNRIDFTKEQEQEIIDLYKNELWSHKKLMKKFNVSQCVIDRVLKENNISPNKHSDYRKKKNWSNKINFTEGQVDKIIYLFEKELKPAEEVGKIMGCSITPIFRVLRENGIDTTGSTRLKKLIDSGKKKILRGKEHSYYGRKPHNIIEFNKKQIRKIINLYNIKFLNTLEIGKIFGCDGCVIRRILKENNINITLSDRRKKLIRNGKIKLWDKTELSKEQENNIINLYIKKLKSPIEIGKILGYSGQVIRRILKENGIKVSLKGRKISKESRIKMSETRKRLIKEGKVKAIGHGLNIDVKGENNPMFNNWASREPYGEEFSPQLKKLVKERDGCCLLCNVNFEDLHLLKKRIHVHHLNYDKQCNLIQNMASLCNSCHTKTNINRPHWTKFFQSLLSERYGYKYSELGEIIIEVRNETK